MADRIYKGVLTFTPSEAFPESSDSFDKPHAGGLVPFELLREVLMLNCPCPVGTCVTEAEYKEINGSLWLSRGDVWIKIDPTGEVEVGISGA